MHSVTLLWKSMNTVSLIIGLTYIVQLLEGCNQNLNPVVVNEADTASFQYNPVSTSGSETYEVKRTGESAKVRLAYTSGSPDAVQTNVRVTFTGSETAGEISFNLGDVEKIDNGTYALKNAAGNELQCIILYIKGVVTVTLSATKNPVEQGEQVNFTCKAESQTVPLVSSYDFSWTFKTDSLTGSSNPRHTLNGQNFLIDDVRTTDSGKYTCTATEDIPNGGTASAEFYLEVNGTTTTTAASTTTTTSSRTSTAMTSTSMAPNTTLVSVPAATITATAESTFTTSATAATAVTSASASAPASMSVASTIKTATSSRKTNQDLITLIIIVSVIGGILVLAIFMLIFLWAHWKNCFIQKSHPKSRSRAPDFEKQGRHHKIYHTGGGYLETQMETRMKDYYFYTGKINPVYDGTLVTSNIYPTEKIFHNPECIEQPPEGSSYLYDCNWKQIDRL